MSATQFEVTDKFIREPGSTALIEVLLLQNFLSFSPDNPPIQLGSLNVLIGVNGSGKSNFIEAISFLRACPNPQGNSDVRSLLSRGGGAEEWIWKGNSAQPAIITAYVSYDLELPLLRHFISFGAEQHRFRLLGEHIAGADERLLSENFFYRNLRTGDPAVGVKTTEGQKRFYLDREEFDVDSSILAQMNDRDRFPEITYLSRQYRKIAVYREWTFGRSTLLRQPQRADMRIDRLEEDFSNLGLILNRLYGIPKVKRELLAHLKDIYAEVDDIHISIVAGTVQIFLTEGDYQIPATRLSDGTLHYLCLLAILCDPTPPPLICLEEPELGLHPDMLPKISDLLIKASERTQLIVKTHSEIIVDAMTSHPEAVLIVEKENGETQIKRIPSRDSGERLGKLWMEGELGGTRW